MSMTELASSLAAMRAASLQMLAMSAPAKPGVKAASLEATSLGSCPSFRGFRCTLKICSLPRMSGLSMVIWRSNLPGRSRAESRMSARLVPARTTTPSLSVNPSISTSSWLRVFSLSSLPPLMPPLPRALPTASISSIKTMQGASARASLNKSLTREGPTPTNISMKSDPLIEKKGTDASPAVAFASRVLPVPGGPTNKAPFGIFAPKRVNLSGFCRNLTNSITSTLASSRPATSLNFTLVPPSSGLNFCALLLPIEKIFLAPPPPPIPPRPPPDEKR
mmetsp:Transcript_32074/g.62725  ORF Transcript_32074/g.62725 Transcript_32074/m.62725 type:complete len:278 (-) Transcript_32074:651-1484(-)